jgi:hypothetical protein
MTQKAAPLADERIKGTWTIGDPARPLFLAGTTFKELARFESDTPTYLTRAPFPPDSAAPMAVR